MDLSRFFHLEGHGYLESLHYSESRCIAKIKVIHSAQQEEIFLESEVAGILEEYLLFFLSAIKQGDPVIISFKAVYRQFAVAFSEAEPNDTQVILMRCKLLNLGNCYINGCLADASNFSVLAAA